MRFHSPPTVVTFAGLALWSVVAAPAQEKPAPAPGETLNTAPVQETVQAAPAFLRWKNGDALPGKLLESEPGQVHWASPLFTDELVVDAGALDSVFFPEQPAPPTEAFRVGTVSGDVWVADLIGADHDSFLFSSLRHGPIRVKRSAVHSLDRRQHPNLVFDGSQLSYWNLQQEGAIKHMTYKVYESKKWSRVRFPDFSELVPVAEGALAVGWLDLRLAKKEDNFGMVFEGRLEANAPGAYTFELASDDNARLLVDGKLLAESSPARQSESRIKLSAGSHALRVEFIEFQGEQRLSAWWSGPDFRRTPLFGSSLSAAWRRAPGGHPQTDRNRAGLSQEVKLPERFEVDLEFTSAEQPRFVVVLGKHRQQAVRLETWQDELVIVQGDLFEPVLTIEKDQHHVQLLLVFDSPAGVIEVFAATGELLAKVEEVQPLEVDSEIAVHNRGEDLSLRRLRIGRHTKAGAQPPVDLSKSRVHLIDGQVLYGRLMVGEGGAHVLAADQTRHKLDLAQVARIARPDSELAARGDQGELSYADGSVLRGRVEQLNADHAILRTAFAEEPVRCALAGAVALQLGTTGKSKKPGREADQLYCESGRLRGRLSFAADGAPFRWYLEGARQPVRLAGTGGARVERSGKNISQKSSFDTDMFPHVLHLKTGEVLPCRIESYDEKTLTFQSPFVRGREMASSHVKGIEFSGLQKRQRSILGNVLEEFGLASQESLDLVDAVKLTRALTVPRFNRENPPSHVLVAKTGDLKRGSLLGISGQNVLFASKLRELSVPIDRLARVIEVSQPDEQADEQADEPVGDGAAEPTVRATLSDGSILVFAVLEPKGGELLGRSPIYGELAVPWAHVKRLNFGDFEKENIRFAFKDWVVREAKEPDFGEPASP